MKKVGIEGPATCREVFEPYYPSPYTLGSMERLEAAIVANRGVEELGEALAEYYRMSDRACAQVAYDRAPNEVQNLHLTMRDAAKALIREAGGTPEDFNIPPTSQISAYE